MATPPNNGPSNVQAVDSPTISGGDSSSSGVGLSQCTDDGRLTGGSQREIVPRTTRMMVLGRLRIQQRTGPIDVRQRVLLHSLILKLPSLLLVSEG